MNFLNQSRISKLWKDKVKMCGETYQTAPSRGFYVSQNMPFGYKFHAVCPIGEVFKIFDLTKEGKLVLPIMHCGY
jgi:hypothetical protein